MTLGERIKEARKSKGLKQIPLAEKIGISIASFQRYERDERQPNIEKLVEIADVLEVPIEQLIYDNYVPLESCIKLVDLTLNGISPSDELLKVDEENREFEMAVLECLCNPNIQTRNHVIEEFWDKVQSSLSYLQITLGIKADDVMELYHLHLEKIKNRPR